MSFCYNKEYADTNNEGETSLIEHAGLHGRSGNERAPADNVPGRQTMLCFLLHKAIRVLNVQ